MSPSVPARRPAPAATLPDDAPPAVLPDVQKAFWLRGDLAGRLAALLADRQARAPHEKIRERALLNEAVELLVARSSSK